MRDKCSVDRTLVPKDKGNSGWTSVSQQHDCARFSVANPSMFCLILQVLKPRNYISQNLLTTAFLIRFCWWEVHRLNLGGKKKSKTILFVSGIGRQTWVLWQRVDKRFWTGLSHSPLNSSALSLPTAKIVVGSLLQLSDSLEAGGRSPWPLLP